MKEGPCWVSLEKARLPGRPFWGCNGYISKTKSSFSQTNWTVNPVFLDCLRTYFEKCDLGSWWHSFWWLVVLDTNSYIIWGWQPMLFLLRKPNAFPPPPLFWNELVLFFFFKFTLLPLFFFFFDCIVFRILVPWPGIEATAPALETWCLNHWTPGEVLNSLSFEKLLTFLEITRHTLGSSKRKFTEA